MPNLEADKNKLKRYVKVLQGSTYLTVAGRVFAAHDARQLVSVKTELHETDTHYRYCATVTVLNSHLPHFEHLPIEAQLGTYTGWSQSLRKGGRSAEGTNPLEVAETSALGRALGFAGFGDLESIASYEEVQVAIARREGDDTEDDNKTKSATAPTAEQKKLLVQTALAAGLAKNVEELLPIAAERYNVQSLGDLTRDQVTEWIEELSAVKAASKKANKVVAPF